jgi:site-specific recombinase XerD
MGVAKKKPTQSNIYNLHDSFERSLLAENLSTHTIGSYLDSLKLFARYLEGTHHFIIAESIQPILIKDFLT